MNLLAAARRRFRSVSSTIIVSAHMSSPNDGFSFDAKVCSWLHRLWSGTCINAFSLFYSGGILAQPKNKKNQYLLAQEGSSNYRQIIVVGRPATLNLKIATQLFLHNILVLTMYQHIKLGNKQFSTSEHIISTNIN